MRPGADAEVAAAAPVVEIVAALAAGPGVVRDLVLRIAGSGEQLVEAAARLLKELE